VKVLLHRTVKLYVANGSVAIGRRHRHRIVPRRGPRPIFRRQLPVQLVSPSPSPPQRSSSPRVPTSRIEMWEESPPAPAPSPQQPAAGCRHQHSRPAAEAAVADHRVCDVVPMLTPSSPGQRSRTQRAHCSRRPPHLAAHNSGALNPQSSQGRDRRRPVARRHAPAVGSGDREVHPGAAQRRAHSV